MIDPVENISNFGIINETIISPFLITNSSNGIELNCIMYHFSTFINKPLTNLLVKEKYPDKYDAAHLLSHIIGGIITERDGLLNKEQVKFVKLLTRQNFGKIAKYRKKCLKYKVFPDYIADHAISFLLDNSFKPFITDYTLQLINVYKLFKNNSIKTSTTIWLYRGIGNTKTLNLNIKGFVYATVSRDISLEYASPNGTLMIIEIPPGIDILPLFISSYAIDQFEFLIMSDGNLMEVKNSKYNASFDGITQTHYILSPSRPKN